MAEFASNGKGNLGVTLGAIGTGLAAFGNNGMGNGILGNILGGSSIKDDKIDALTSDLMRERCERYTDQKICDLKSLMYDKFDAFNTSVSNKFDGVNSALCAQNVWNATNTSTITCLTNQINQLTSLLTYGISSSKVITSTTTDSGSGS